MATKNAKTTFLGEAWFEQVGGLATSGALNSEVAARVQGVISGGPDGEVKCRFVFDGGALATFEIGVEADADLTLTVVYNDAVAMQKGELAPSVAFMQGRMKTAGDPGLVLKLLPVTAAPEYEVLRAQVDGVTEY